MKKAINDVEKNDLNETSSIDKFHREVEVVHYSFKGNARTSYCSITMTSQGKTVSCESETVSKDYKEAKLLRRRAEAVGYARCLVELDDAIEQDKTIN